MKRYGYHRTSTREQHLDRGIKEITAYCEQNNLELEKIFTDQQTGKNFNRPRYQVLKEDVLRAGDELIITEVDRLGRNKQETLKELQYYRDNGIRVKILELQTTLMDLSKLDNAMARMLMETINNMEWFIENKSMDKHSVAATKTYGTSRMDAYSIFEDTLNLKTVTVRDRIDDGDGRYHYEVNKNETMLAREKQNLIKEKFKEWLFAEPERRQKYVEYYNETFNNIRLREYDGSHLQFPGMNPVIELKKSLKKEKKIKVEDSRVLSVVKVVVFPLLFAGIVVCAIYLAMQQKAAQDDLRTTVVCMKADVAPNTYVEAKDIDKYFTNVKIQIEAVSENAIKSLSDFAKDGFYIEDAMKKSQMVLDCNIASKDEVMDKYLAGYEVTSFDAQNFADGVNGFLRKGDIVDVYALDSATELLTLYAENVYVADVYDNSGKKVTEKDGIATSFSVWVTSEKVENLNLAVVYGGVQMYLKTE